LSSARDRSGILFCRRQKRYKRIARFFTALSDPSGLAPQKMRHDVPEKTNFPVLNLGFRPIEQAG
jgi:hypothetical protein